MPALLLAPTAAGKTEAASLPLDERHRAEQAFAEARDCGIVAPRRWSWGSTAPILTMIMGGEREEEVRDGVG